MFIVEVERVIEGEAKEEEEEEEEEEEIDIDNSKEGIVDNSNKGINKIEAL